MGVITCLIAYNLLKSINLMGNCMPLLAKKCIKIMCEKYKMKGLLIGRINCDLPPKCHTILDTTDKLVYSKFMKQFERCRFIFVPNKFLLNLVVVLIIFAKFLFLFLLLNLRSL